MAGNNTVDLLSSNTVDDSTNHSTTKQSMAAVLKRLHACDSRQLLSLCSSFGISQKRSQDILIVMIQDHLRQNPSLLSPNGTIPLQLLLSRGGSQSKPLTVDRLEVLSWVQLITFCKMFGVSSIKPKSQLVDELRTYLTSNPCAVTEDGVIVPGNEKSLSSNSSKKTLSKPVCLHRLAISHQDDIWVMCRSYGISIMIPKVQLFERFRAHLHEHPEIIRADGTVDLVALANTKG
ncbi:hypothetical protein BASA62_004328 [Batrachochytrium salamandrivorans]|nr:hypothetical protein BASA62_004328 [Batrachochytrium salamandrivorans]